MPRIGLLATLVLTLLAGVAQGQNYPSRPILLVVPFTPGTGIDILRSEEHTSELQSH